MKIKVKEVSYHRNGIGGEGFTAILFDWKDDDGKQRRPQNSHLVIHPFSYFRSQL